MANFAKLDSNNLVLSIVHVADETTATEGGIEREEIGLVELVKRTGHYYWKQYSFNTFAGVHANGKSPLRANAAQVGWYYNPQYDIFHPPQPVDDDGDGCTSFTLNTTTGFWDPPIPKPDLTEDQITNDLCYRWDESAYQENNTQGWVLKNRVTLT